jgi:transposase
VKEWQIILIFAGYHPNQLSASGRFNWFQSQMAQSNFTSLPGEPKIGTRLPALEKAWQLKEALRSWYATATVADAAQLLDAWIKQVQQEGPTALQEALSPFKNWRHEILAFFQFLPILVSNGFVEGKNNRTKTMMRQAYGYRSHSNLRMRILLGADT